MQNQLKVYQDRVNQALNTLLETEKSNHPNTPERLHLAMHYATLNNGKRLRPALIYAIGEALQIPLEKLDSAACAIELIHSYSLVHDDLPAMDNDDLRRGLPTCHIQFDEATAILVGDAQQTLAFNTLANDAHTSDHHKVQLMQLLSHASGLAGMIGGQMLDIQSEDNCIPLATLKTMHLMKTGALIKVALLMGACQSTRFQALRHTLEIFGEAVGLAFQVQDDILDIESDTATLGKPQGSDLQANKSTYPKLLGIEASKTYRDELITQALASLHTIKLHSPFLENLTQYIAKRAH